jgi:hypothetical protein
MKMESNSYTILRKVTVQLENNKIIVDLYYPSLPPTTSLIATMIFYIKEGTKWYVGFDIRSSENIIIDAPVKQKIQEQLVLIFAPYFDLIMEKDKPW